VEAIFNVKVKSVNTLNRSGKTVRNRRNGITASKTDQKRAIVTLKGDDRIPLFEA
jgi:large subunit ribosomal protein L23